MPAISSKVSPDLDAWCWFQAQCTQRPERRREDAWYAFRHGHEQHGSCLSADSVLITFLNAAWPDQKSGIAVPCLTSNLLNAHNLDRLDPKEEEDIKCVSGVLYAGKSSILPSFVVGLIHTYPGAVDTVRSFSQ